MIAVGAMLLVLIVALLTTGEKPRTSGRSSPFEGNIPAELTQARARPPQPAGKPLGRYRPGAITKVPRFVAAPAAGPDGGLVPASPPPRLESRGTGELKNRLPQTPPNFEEMQAKVKALLGKMQERADKCLTGWSAPDPALKEGVMLAIELDKAGLQAVSIKDMVEIPDGPLRCLSNAAYELDWGGITESPVMLTVPQKYAAP